MGSLLLEQEMYNNPKVPERFRNETKWKQAIDILTPSHCIVFSF